MYFNVADALNVSCSYPTSSASVLNAGENFKGWRYLRARKKFAGGFISVHNQELEVNRRGTGTFEVCTHAHVASRIVHYSRSGQSKRSTDFSAITSAKKLHKNKGHVALLSGPTV